MARKLFERGYLPPLVGGTAWAFAQEAAEGHLDYLFVDEAGQVSVANLVAMASSTRNIVLFGDQMQLTQPIQGTHPGESGQSILDYLLQGQATIPDDFGIFLGRTWRLHPQVCRFISGAVYDDRLESMPFTAERVIVGDRSLHWLHREAGILYIPVDHEDNMYESQEEGERISELIADLTQQQLRTKEGTLRDLTNEDILVVAPYNLQVHHLERRLGNVRVGTVDKFQGQQAPVVIFSMTASSGNAAARGVEFLFSQSRLNVAISRAQTLAIIVGHPSLERTACSTIEQMRLVNVYCRAIHTAQGVSFSAAQ